MRTSSALLLAGLSAIQTRVDDLKLAVARFERLHIARILEQTPDKREAAKRLNIGLSSLYRKLEEGGE